MIDQPSYYDGPSDEEQYRDEQSRERYDGATYIFTCQSCGRSWRDEWYFGSDKTCHFCGWEFFQTPRQEPLYLDDETVDF